jgi:hypothetical protein
LNQDITKESTKRKKALGQGLKEVAGAGWRMFRIRLGNQQRENVGRRRRGK